MIFGKHATIPNTNTHTTFGNSIYIILQETTFGHIFTQNNTIGFTRLAGLHGLLISLYLVYTWGSGVETLPCTPTKTYMDIPVY